MNKIKQITQEDFLKKYKVGKINLIKKGLFLESDIEELQELDSVLSRTNYINTLLSYLRFSISHPMFIYSFIIPQVKNRVMQFSPEKTKWKDSSLVKANNLKANIALAFKPKRILEIGTYLGVGAAAFKTALPSATVFTMCPKSNVGANNPIQQNYIGHFYKKKKLKIKQIFADSTKFNYSKLGKVDFSFIDGNHSYEFVTSDIANLSKITTKSILLDDYIPISESTSDLPYGSWNDGVVRSVDYFLKNNPSVFSEAYWIKGTKYAVLIK